MSNIEKKFIQAVKTGLTFKTSKGSRLPQDLYKMPIERKDGDGGYSLEEVGDQIVNVIAEAEKGGILQKGTASQEDLLRLDIVKHIIEDKQAEIKAKEDKKAIETHNAEIDELINRAKKNDLLTKTPEELEKLKK
ncbi:hypothetical protein VCHA53O466_50013 [Vibrio chagasii]|nr:hypothetical protein VCHA53O466_50013 [Vibrio chagasii]